MLRATLSRPDFTDPALAETWNALAESGRRSPFLHWSWAGCLAAERYTDPLLLTVREAGAPVGMALLGHSRARWGGRSLHLNETGNKAEDAAFVEHNGINSAPGREDALLQALFNAAGRRRVVMSGVDDTWLSAARGAGGVIGHLHTRLAPFRLLAPGAGGPSRNTRAQLARSTRAYGRIDARRAASVAEALDWFDAMMVWHEATWAARRIATPLSTPPLQRFLRALIARGVPEARVEMLRVAGDAGPIGFLLNLRAGGRVANYQGGFDYAGAPPNGKPGLACHAADIALAETEGAGEYDFLAGDARYKRSLSNAARPMHWLTWQPTLSPWAAVAMARRALRP